MYKLNLEKKRRWNECRIFVQWITALVKNSIFTTFSHKNGHSFVSYKIVDKPEEEESKVFRYTRETQVATQVHLICWRYF